MITTKVKVAVSILETNSVFNTPKLARKWPFNIYRREKEGKDYP